MSNQREAGPEEQALVSRLSELLNPVDAGSHLAKEGTSVLLYAMVPTAELPAGIIGISAYWLCQVLKGSNHLGRLVFLLSRAVKQWLTERSEGVPLVA